MKSIVTEYTDICIFCGGPAECEHHLIFGNSLRKLADADGLKVPACNKCHNIAIKPEDRIHGNPIAEKLSKQLGQAIWEAHYGDREAFRKRYGISFM